MGPDLFPGQPESRNIGYTAWSWEHTEGTTLNNFSAVMFSAHQPACARRPFQLQMNNYCFRQVRMGCERN